MGFKEEYDVIFNEYYEKKQIRKLPLFSKGENFKEFIEKKNKLIQKYEEEFEKTLEYKVITKYFKNGLKSRTKIEGIDGRVVQKQRNKFAGIGLNFLIFNEPKCFTYYKRHTNDDSKDLFRKFDSLKELIESALNESEERLKDEQKQILMYKKILKDLSATDNKEEEK